MGRLPSTFAGKPIKGRLPFEMPGDMAINFSVSGQVFQDVLFTNVSAYPFEIHRMIPRVAGLDDNALVVSPQPDQDELQALVRLDLLDFRTDLKMTKAATFIRDLIKGSSERTWEWAEPYTLPNSGGFQVSATTLAAPAAYAGLAVPITQLRVEVVFEGFFLIQTAPSDAP
jgi:hypothetical protein